MFAATEHAACFSQMQIGRSHGPSLFPWDGFSGRAIACAAKHGEQHSVLNRILYPRRFRNIPRFWVSRFSSCRVWVCLVAGMLEELRKWFR
jgi:hypothetical protein